MQFKKMKKLVVISLIWTISFVNGVTNVELQTPPHSRMLVGPPKPVINTLIMCDVEVFVPGLVCSSCAIGVKKNLANLFFISPKDIKFDTKKQSVCLELSNFVDGDRKTFLKKYESKIKKAVKDAGYEVKKIKVSQKAFV